MGLAGQRVLITRSTDDEAGLRALLEARGADVIALPTLVRAPPDDPEAVVAAARRLRDVDAVAVGSLAALRPLAEVVDETCTAVIGCVGDKTAEGLDADPLLAARFVGPRVVPNVFRAEALVDALRAHFGGTLEGRRVSVPRAPEGRTVLGDGLRAAGATVDEVMTYRIRPADPPSAEIWAAAQAADAALFLSGQTLANLLVIVPENEARAFLARTVVGVIGPVAAAKAATLGLRVDVVPSVATQAALVDALEAHLNLCDDRRA